MNISKQPAFGRERRRHKRVELKQGAYAAISPNSFKIGQIKNISRGGLLFSYIDTQITPENPVENHLFLSSTNAYVSKLPFRTMPPPRILSSEEVALLGEVTKRGIEVAGESTIGVGHSVRRPQENYR